MKEIYVFTDVHINEVSDYVEFEDLQEAKAYLVSTVNSYVRPHEEKGKDWMISDNKMSAWFKRPHFYHTLNITKVLG